MEPKISFLGFVLIVSAISIFQESQCVSLGKRIADGKLQIPRHDRSTCLEKLICGINLVGGTKSGSSGVKDYANQVDLIRRFFQLYPFVESDDAAEADDEIKVEPPANSAGSIDDDESEDQSGDYNVELEDIVHKPKSKQNAKRTNSKRRPSKNTGPKKQVIFGATGLPISESISLTGRLIKSKRKSQPELLRSSDESIITQLHNKQLMERISRKLWSQDGRKGGNCGEIVCPYSFKQIYESLQEVDIDSSNSPAAPIKGLSDEEDPSEEVVLKQVSALSSQNLPTQGAAYTISSDMKTNNNQYASAGLEGFFHSTDELQYGGGPLSLALKKPSQSKYSSKKKKKRPVKATTARPRTKAVSRKKAVANHDLVGTIAPPHKTINYRPAVSEDEKDKEESGDDEVDDINKTSPVQLLGHPEHDEDLKEIQLKLKHRPSVHHREEEEHDDERGSVSDENHDDYDEEAKYEVQVDYGNDDEEDDDEDDVSEEKIRVKPKRKSKPTRTAAKPSVSKLTNPSIDYFQTSSIGKRNKKKEAEEIESSEEDQDDDIDSEVYSVLYSRDSFNIGGRPMTAPGDVPIEMTSMGLMRQRSGGGQPQAQPNLSVRNQKPRTTPRRTKTKPNDDDEPESKNSSPVKPSHSAAHPSKPLVPSSGYVQYSSSSSEPMTDMSTGISFSKLTAPFQSLFKLVREGNMFQGGHSTAYQQSYPHYQNQRPSVFHQHNIAQHNMATHTVEPEATLKIAKPAPAPPPAFNPVVVNLARPVGPESSQFKRYKVQKKDKKSY